MKNALIVMAILALISSPIWLWILGLWTRQDWMFYPIAWCMRAIFWMGGYRS